MRKNAMLPDRIVQVRYQASASYALDVEIFTLAEFRRRVSAKHLGTPQRVQFHMLLYLAAGRCTHWVDFESVACRPGTLLVLGPGQIQRFETRSVDWDGWMVIYRPEFLEGRAGTTVRSELDVLHQLVDLAVHRTLSGSEQEAVTECLSRMAADARLRANAAALHALLRPQLQALLVRLHVIQARGEAASSAAPVPLQRFKRFRLAIDQELHHFHRVADYAKLIGCSQKSLQRATFAVTGTSAKAFLSQKIVLEAKRLLVHTGESVSIIAELLGFDEATNFVKFFRRASGRAPGEFRREHTVR